MLWESTVTFQVLSSVFTAAVLVAFVVLAMALAWRQNLQVIPWIATLAAVATALALIIATRDLVPFTVGLLGIALATEITICWGRQHTVRPVPGIAADFAVWLLVYLMTSPEGAPSEYRPVGATTITALCLALLAIYAGSIGLRSLGLRDRLTIFEIGQGVVAFVLATFGTLRASPGSAAALGGFFLLVAAVCYWGALSRFTVEVETRNRRVCATYAVALLLAGNLLLFPVSFQVPFLSLAAVAAALLYVRTNKLSLGIHVSIYLLAAAILSGLLNLAGKALAGTLPSGLDASTWVVTASAVLCYAIGWRLSFDQWKPRLLWIVPCVLVAGVAAALAVMVGVRLGAGSGVLNAPHLSVVRTLVTCSVALTLGFGGSRLKHAELVWAAYLAIAFGTLKLLFEDLRFGNATSLVASLLFYGLVLILIPWLTRSGRDRPCSVLLHAPDEKMLCDSRHAKLLCVPVLGRADWTPPAYPPSTPWFGRDLWLDDGQSGSYSFPSSRQLRGHGPEVGFGGSFHRTGRKGKSSANLELVGKVTVDDFSRNPRGDDH